MTRNPAAPSGSNVQEIAVSPNCRVRLTAADHERNGFVSLAQSQRMTEAEAATWIAEVDATVCDEAEPDIKTAPFTFILDLCDDATGDTLDTGRRFLPTQVAMALAPDQVRQWLDERPDPDSVMFRHVPAALRQQESRT